MTGILVIAAAFLWIAFLPKAFADDPPKTNTNFPGGIFWMMAASRTEAEGPRAVRSWDLWPLATVKGPILCVFKMPAPAEQREVMPIPKTNVYAGNGAIHADRTVLRSKETQTAPVHHPISK